MFEDGYARASCHAPAVFSAAGYVVKFCVYGNTAIGESVVNERWAESALVPETLLERALKKYVVPAAINPAGSNWLAEPVEMLFPGGFVVSKSRK